MPTIVNEKTKKTVKQAETNIKAPLNPKSYDANNGSLNTLNIKFTNPSDDVNGVYAGQDVYFAAELSKCNIEDYRFIWRINAGSFIGANSKLVQDATGARFIETDQTSNTIGISTSGVAGNSITLSVTAVPFLSNQSGTGFVSNDGDIRNGDDTTLQAEYSINLTASKSIALREPRVSDLKGDFDAKMDQIADRLNNGVSVRLQRTQSASTDDLALWVVIRRSTEAAGFNNYANFMDMLLYGRNRNSYQNSSAALVNRLQDETEVFNKLSKARFLPFNDTDAYRLLKVATEAFLLVNGGVLLNEFEFIDADVAELNTRLGGGFNRADLTRFWDTYLEDVNGTPNATLPYLAIIRNKLSDEHFKSQLFLTEDTSTTNDDNGRPDRFTNVLRKKLMRPFLLELIWSYWQEEGMLVQTLNAITRRFQNMRGPNGGKDPLANLEMDSLRPLNNLLWGYLQDEQHRLSVARRSYEYDHHYGISLQGKAIPQTRSAESRSRFIEAFHHLLHLCSTFFKQDDDTTVIADGFPILNALREVHLILSQGAHNQFGDLPSTARQEMLLQQWLLARPEFREYLPSRMMVAYPEPWMDRVDAMKSLQGWSDVPSVHFNHLAIFGEQLLLSIRFGAWIEVTQPAQAANWARFWRAEIQGYIHSYRAVTGVDLMSANKVDSTPPSVHLRNRILEQARRR